MSHMTLLTGAERRRRWSQDTRERILEAAFSPGAVVADVARRFEVSTSLIYKWRQESFTSRPQLGFAPAVLVDGPAPVVASPVPAIMVEFPSGARVSLSADAPVALVAATIRGLR